MTLRKLLTILDNDEEQPRNREIVVRGAFDYTVSGSPFVLLGWLSAKRLSDTVCGIYVNENGLLEVRT